MKSECPLQEWFDELALGGAVLCFRLPLAERLLMWELGRGRRGDGERERQRGRPAPGASHPGRRGSRNHSVCPEAAQLVSCASTPCPIPTNTSSPQPMCMRHLTVINRGYVWPTDCTRSKANAAPLSAPVHEFVLLYQKYLLNSSY